MATITEVNLLERRDIGFERRGKEITYSMFESAIVDFTASPPAKNDIYVDTSIALSLIGGVDQEVVAASKGKYTANDTTFRVKQEDMPELRPNKKSTIIFSSTRYGILGYRKSPNTLTYDIYCREEA